MIAFVGLGSNLGDREAQIRLSLEQLGSLLRRLFCFLQRDPRESDPFAGAQLRQKVEIGASH